MTLEQQLSDAIAAQNALTQVVANKMAAINQATADQQAAFTANLNRLSGFRNKIINGDFRVSQKNGSSPVPIIAGDPLNYVIDQFYAYSVGGNATATRIAGAGPDLYRHKLSGGAGITEIGIAQRMEYLNVYHMAGKPAIFGVDLANTLLSTVTWSIFAANLLDGFGTIAAPTRTLIATGTFNNVTANIQRFYTPIINITPNLGIEIELSVGPQIGGDFIHGNWQFEQVPVGATQGTEFERTNYADQLRWCQRFFELGVATIGLQDATNAAIHPVVGKFQVPKRALPTVVNSSSLTLNPPATAGSINGAAGLTSCSLWASSINELYFSTTAVGSTAGYHYYSYFSASSQL